MARLICFQSEQTQWASRFAAHFRWQDEVLLAVGSSSAPFCAPALSVSLTFLT
jgi:hypothetical protein